MAVAVQAVLVVQAVLAVWPLPVQAAPDLVEQLQRQLTLPLSFSLRHVEQLFQIFSTNEHRDQREHHLVVAWI